MAKLCAKDATRDAMRHEPNTVKKTLALGPAPHPAYRSMAYFPKHGRRVPD